MNHDEYRPKDMPGSVLNPVADQELIRKILYYADLAGLAGAPQYIWQTIKGEPSVTEQDFEMLPYLVGLNAKKGVHGLVYVSSDLNEKFMRMVGCMTRHYDYASYMPLQEVLMGLKEDELPAAEVVFIPDFFYAQSRDVRQTRRGRPQQVKLDTWRRDLLMFLLQKCQALGKTLVLGVSDTELMQEAYGPEIGNFILKYYYLMPAE